jgi:hypothetical protein
MAPWVWLLCLMAFNVVVLYVPTHLVMRRVFDALPCRSDSSGKRRMSRWYQG